MNDSQVWELVCHHLNASDVSALLETDTLRHNLSSRQSLWSFLMKRDFPEHYKLSSSAEHELWYKDLHHHGAFFTIQEGLILYPAKLLFANPVEDVDDDLIISTTRTRQGLANAFLRFPGQTRVNLFKKSQLNKWWRAEKLAAFPRDFSMFRHNNVDYLFVRGHEEWTNGVRIDELQKHDDSRFAPTVAWISEYFVATRIIASSDCWTDSYRHFHVKEFCEFEGMLREEYRRPLPSQMTTKHISQQIYLKNTRYKIDETGICVKPPSNVAQGMNSFLTSLISCQIRVEGTRYPIPFFLPKKPATNTK